MEGDLRACWLVGGYKKGPIGWCLLTPKGGRFMGLLVGSCCTKGRRFNALLVGINTKVMEL
jgi:hypothetical protein